MYKNVTKIIQSVLFFKNSLTKYLFHSNNEKKPKQIANVGKNVKSRIYSDWAGNL